MESSAKLCFGTLLVCLLSVCGAVDLECEYKNYGKGYSCVVLGAKVDINESVNIEGEHEGEFNDTDVKIVSFYGSDVKQIVDEIFDKFENLEILDLQLSRLSEIDQTSLVGAHTLRKLNMRGNDVNRLESEVFSEAYNLESICLQDNLIDFVDEDAFNNLTKLERLYLGKNNIVELHKETFSDLVSLKVIYFSSNMIQQLEEGLFKTNMMLEFVGLRNNKLTIIDPQLFKHLKHLNHVNLNKNTCINKTFKKQYLNWPSLPEEIVKCSKFNTLDAKNHGLLIELEELKLNQTKLDKVLDDLEFNNNVKTNRISDLQKNIAKMTKNMQTSTNHSTICLKSLETCESEKKEFEGKANECHVKHEKMIAESLQVTTQSPITSFSSNSSADKSTLGKVKENTSPVLAASNSTTEQTTDKPTEKPGFFDSILQAMEIPVVVDDKCNRDLEKMNNYAKENEICEKAKKNCEQERDMYKFWRQD